MNLSKLALSASLLAILAAQSAQAQQADQSAPAENRVAAADEGTGVTDIVVTARRIAENLQNVPQTVTAVSGETVGKLAITQFEDVASLVPGLTLGIGDPSTGGFAAPSLRGVPYDFLASQSPTVDIYFNEVPFETRLAYAGMFDLGDIQVLQGPQGTARGRTAPSGAILLSPKRPDLNEWGGYASGLAATHGEVNVQGALNIPIISDVFALRVAGLYSRTEADFVRSANSPIDPLRRDLGIRVTALIEPTDNLDVQITYQHLDQNTRQFSQVEGLGAPGLPGGSSLAPPGFNGPPITASDRLGVNEFPSQIDFDNDLVTAQINWNVLGHRISYVGGYYESFFDRNSSAGDRGNLLVGTSIFQVSGQNSKQTTHEFRIASDGDDNLIDYTFGYFYSKGRSRSFTDQTQVFLRGAFGPSATDPDPTLLNLRYTLPLSTIVPPGGVTENSFFATAIIHAGPKTEITLGGRYLMLNQRIQLTSSIASGFVIASPNFGLPCSALSASLVESDYPGFCDFPVGPIGVVAGFAKRAKEKPFVFNASVSHRFTDDILAYANVASSYRLGFVNIGVQNGNNDPLLTQLSLPTPEKSTSFELGLKTNWLDNRLRLNVSAFYQKFKGLLYQTPPVPYRSVAGGEGVSTFGFNTNADAIVKGFNVDVAFQPTRNWSISGGVNYSKTNVDNDTIPCRDANFDGVEDDGTPTLQGFINAGQYVALCKSKTTVTRDPLWNATLQSEFSQPIGAAEGYVRGLFTYYPKNPRRSPNFTVDNYALLNLYAGIRSPDGMWDFGLFARNVTNTGVQLSRGLDDAAQGDSAADFFGPSGYNITSFTPPRQFGVNLRYAFGSR